MACETVSFNTQCCLWILDRPHVLHMTLRACLEQAAYGKVVGIEINSAQGTQGQVMVCAAQDTCTALVLHNRFEAGPHQVHRLALHARCCLQGQSGVGTTCSICPSLVLCIECHIGLDHMWHMLYVVWGVRYTWHVGPVWEYILHVACVIPAPHTGSVASLDWAYRLALCVPVHRACLAWVPHAACTPNQPRHSVQHVLWTRPMYCK